MAHTPNHPSQNDQTKRDMPGKHQDQGQQGNKKTEQGQDQTRKDSPQRDDRDAGNR